jgi:ferrous iron transport protein A
MSQNKHIPLCSLESDRVGVILSLKGGQAMTSRLAILGFTPGTELTMVQNYGWGPVIVQVRDTRIALGRGEARKISVRPTSLP